MKVILAILTALIFIATFIVVTRIVVGSIENDPDGKWDGGYNEPPL